MPKAIVDMLEVIMDIRGGRAQGSSYSYEILANVGEARQASTNCGEDRDPHEEWHVK